MYIVSPTGLQNIETEDENIFDLSSSTTAYGYTWIDVIIQGLAGITFEQKWCSHSLKRLDLGVISQGRYRVVALNPADATKEIHLQERKNQQKCRRAKNSQAIKETERKLGAYYLWNWIISSIQTSLKSQPVPRGGWTQLPWLDGVREIIPREQGSKHNIQLCNLASIEYSVSKK